MSMWETKATRAKPVYVAPAQRLRYFLLNVVSATFLLLCFVCLKKSTCETRKNDFYFTLKALFIRDNQILNFQIFKCHGVIKCPSMKHETHFIE